MNLTDAQKQTVKKWIDEGLKLAEIQKKLGTEFSLNPTYMEVRFLVDDLKVMPKDPEPPKAPTPPPAAATPPPPAGPEDGPFDDSGNEVAEPPAPSPLDPANPPVLGGKVTVGVDKIALPGSLVSGTVTFSDGVSAQWYLDETGRLGMVPKTKGYRPPPADIQTFQLELQKQLQTLGF